MAACTAVRRARLDIDTFVITIEFITFTLGTTLTTSTHQLASTLGTGSTAASIGILYAFPRLGIDVESVDALQDFALALCTCAAFPSRDGIGARTVMQTAVFNGINFTGILIDVHAFGAFAHLACRIYAITRFPAVHGQTAGCAMNAAIVQIVGFTSIFIQMQTFLTCADLACAICTSAF